MAIGPYLRRRLGDEVVDHLIDPLVGGINAGDTTSLSLAAVVPQLDAAARSGRERRRRLGQHREMRGAGRDRDAEQAVVVEVGRAMAIELGFEAQAGEACDPEPPAEQGIGAERRIGTELRSGRSR